MTELEKRLIAAMDLGFRIEHRDGHRWIMYNEVDDFDFEHELRRKGILLNDKIYGSVSDALDIIDKCLTMIESPTLLEYFWMPEEDVTGSYGYDGSRITAGKLPGHGGIY